MNLTEIYKKALRVETGLVVLEEGISPIERYPDGTPREEGSELVEVLAHLEEVVELRDALDRIPKEKLRAEILPVLDKRSHIILEWMIWQKFGGLLELAELLEAAYKIGINPLPSLRKHFPGIDVRYASDGSGWEAVKKTVTRLIVWQLEDEGSVRLEIVPAEE